MKPIAASDDGVHTRLRFAANADLPALFVRNDDGSESLLNFSVEAGDVIIHRVARRFILRRGKLTGCVVNKGSSAAGMRLESGTVAPDVERECKEAPMKRGGVTGGRSVVGERGRRWSIGVAVGAVPGEQCAGDRPDELSGCRRARVVLHE